MECKSLKTERGLFRLSIRYIMINFTVESKIDETRCKQKNVMDTLYSISFTAV